VTGYLSWAIVALDLADAFERAFALRERGHDQIDFFRLETGRFISGCYMRTGTCEEVNVVGPSRLEVGLAIERARELGAKDPYGNLPEDYRTLPETDHGLHAIGAPSPPNDPATRAIVDGALAAVWLCPECNVSRLPDGSCVNVDCPRASLRTAEVRRVCNRCDGDVDEHGRCLCPPLVADTSLPLCSTCIGTGRSPGNDNVTCPSCGGSGNWEPVGPDSFGGTDEGSQYDRP
jgi:rubredoxin